jgi:hypothetical protein
MLNLVKPACVALGIGFALFVSSARADEAMTAEVLFNDGVRLMKAKDFATGCPKIAESQRLEPRPGTLFTLAECLAGEGKLATALARYEEYLRVFSRMTPAEQGKQRGRDGIAKSQRDALSPRVPQLKIVLPPEAPAGTKVKKDGVELGAATLNTWLPVNPGKQVIEIELPDGAKKRSEVSLPEGRQRELVLDLPQTTAKSSEPVTTPVESEVRPKKTKKDDTLGWVALGIGGAGFLTSAITGVMVLGKKSTVDENCGIGGDEKACNAEGKSAADSAQTLGLVSTIGFAVGVVGVGTGTYLLVSGSSSSRSGSIALSGRF